MNLDPSKVNDGGNELYDNYREMAEANGVDQNAPVLGELSMKALFKHDNEAKRLARLQGKNLDFTSFK